MATFYFNAAVDGDWQTLGNWWMAYNAGTDTHSVPATGLPTSTDSIEVRGNIASNSGTAPTVMNAAFAGSSGGYGVSDKALTITGNGTFNDTSYNYGTISGNCVFNDTSLNYGTISGNCVFNDNAYNGLMAFLGTVSGDCEFNDSSYNSVTITGDCIFNDSSYNTGTITGDCTFNANATNYVYNIVMGFFVPGTVNGNCTFSLSSAALHIDQALARIKTSDSITGTIDFKYEKGINGSSILGVV